MSYILDALKRADAERERGHVPGLHSNAHGSTLAPSRLRRTGPLLWAGLGVAVTAPLVVWWLWPQSTVTPVVAAPTQSISQQVAMPKSAPGGMPEARPVLPPEPPPATPGNDNTPSGVAVGPNDAPRRPMPVSPGAITPALVDVAEPSKSVVEPHSALQNQNLKISANSSVAAGTFTHTATPEKMVAVPSASTTPTDLSEEFRRQLPPLQISGAVYSSNPSQRLLLVNGLVLPQGSNVAQDLVIDEIGPNSSILKFKGQRFRIKH
jgi:general secretion pathway protein B